MSPLQKKRLTLVVFLIAGLGIAGALVLYALSNNINLFYTPTQLQQNTPTKGKTVRVGGMVVKNSIQRKANMAVEFSITDYKHQMQVHYQGILPDLFKEGQGIVALGKIDTQGHFQASQVLAKHDENYMPREVRQALKEKTRT